MPYLAEGSLLQASKLLAVLFVLLPLELCVLLLLAASLNQSLLAVLCLLLSLFRLNLGSRKRIAIPRYLRMITNRFSSTL